MTYIYRVRKMLKLIDHKTNNPDRDDSALYHSGRPTVALILREFEKLNKRFTPDVARTTLDIAEGSNYVSIKTEYLGSTVRISSNGHILITKSGYINALSASLGKTWPVLTVLIALAALATSIWAILEN